MTMPCTLVRFPSEEVAGLDLKAEDYDELVNAGIPANVFGRFVAASRLTPLVASGRQLICLGTWGSFVKICLDRATGEILQSVAPDESLTFVNTSIAHFRATAEAVLSNFPFHASGAEVEDREVAAKEIGGIIEGIDPPAMELDQFWSTVVDDIVIGDFDEEIVQASRPLPG
jgi:hypothetical protein